MRLPLLGVSGPTVISTTAVSVDSSSESSSPIGTSLTFSHTCLGSNRLLVVSIVIASPTTISSVKYNGIDLIQLGAAQNTPGTEIQMWYLIAPAIGSNSVVIQITAPGSINAGAISFTNVHQTIPLGVIQTAQGLSTLATVSVPGTTSNDIIVDVVGAVPFNGIPGAGQTEQWNNSTTKAASGSTKMGSGAGTMSWSFLGSIDWVMGAVAVKPV